MNLLAQADLLLLAADLLAPPGSMALPSSTEVVATVEVAGLPEAEDLVRLLAQALDLAASAEKMALQAEFNRLFEGGMACPLTEATLVRRDKGAILADLTGFYAAFGFAPRPGTGERPDHAIAQLEFAGMLLARLAAAREAGDAPAVDVTQQALAALADDHISQWLPTACARLLDTTRLEYYAAVALAVSGLWSALSAVHGWPVEACVPTTGEAEPEDPYECGMIDAPSDQLVSLRIGHR
jgi:nitrate reductase assembly molybdenum cofactor insertion protein NarJ